MIDFSTLDLTTLVLVAGILGYLVDRVLDAKGWSRSSRTLRRENEDLVRRNLTLEETVARHERTIAEQDRQIKTLGERIDDLKQRDQQAVLHVLEANARRSEERHAEAVEVWTQIRDAVAGKTP